jgi:hypothetical protein
MNISLGVIYPVIQYCESRGVILSVVIFVSVVA